MHLSCQHIGAPETAVLRPVWRQARRLVWCDFADLGDFSQLVAKLLFIAGYVAMVVGVFRMRRLAPSATRPFRAWGFPLTGGLRASFRRA